MAGDRRLLLRLCVFTFVATTLVSAAEDIWGPHITREPQNTTFNLNSNLESVNLDCEAEASPKARYYWQKDGQNVTLSDRIVLIGGRLTINNPTIADDRGAYQCFASNKVGTVMSRVADLLFAYVMAFPPGAPPSAELTQYEGGCITCNIPDYYPGILVTWFKNNFPLRVSSGQRVTHDGRLCFASVQTGDGGLYHCSVASVIESGGSSTQQLSRAFELTIISNTRPNVESAPTPGVAVADRTALQGEDVILECFFFGNPAPRLLSWTRKNKELPSKAVPDHANQQLRIPEVEPADAGEYECTASNDVQENVKIFGTVEVKVPPQWTTPLEDVSADIYAETTTLECMADSPDDVWYEWFLNSELLTTRDRHTFSNNQQTLTIADLERTDTAIYQCVARNEFGSAFSTGQLTVRAIAPTFLVPLKINQPAPREGSVTIQCRPDAAPQPEFQWFKGDEKITTGGRYTIEANGDLMISDVVDDDAGSYKCVAENSEGIAESTGSVVVRDGTSIQESPEAKVIEVGSTYTLRCSATTDDVFELEYFWMKGETQIDIEDSEYYEMESGNLIIRDVQLMHAGYYTCVAQTTVDRAETSAQIDVKGPPGAPTGVTAEIVSSDNEVISVTVSWNPGADHFSEIVYYKVESMTEFMPEWKEERSNIPNTDMPDKSTRINNISPWNTYQFRVIAQNDLGFGEPSEPSEAIETPERRPSMTPSNVRGCCGGIGNLKIEWDPLSMQDWNAPDLRYLVEYRLRESENEDIFESTETTEEEVAYLVVEGVDPYTPYVVRVRAKNGQGMGPFSADAVVYSYQELPKAVPMNVAGKPSSGSSVKVTWKAIPDNNFNGTLGGYKVKYWPSSESIETAQVHRSPYAGTATEVIGLSYNTAYTMVVVAFNGDNENGPDSDEFDVKTLKSPPKLVPSNLKAVPKGKTSMTVSWNAITTSNSEETLSGYKVLYWKEGMFEKDAMMVEVDAETRQITIDGLSKVIYLVKVRGYSAGGDGAVTGTPVKANIGQVQSDKSTGGGASQLSVSVTFLFVLSLLSLAYQHL